LAGRQIVGGGGDYHFTVDLEVEVEQLRYVELFFWKVIWEDPGWLGLLFWSKIYPSVVLLMSRA
jgi:hypothetical protein